MKNIKGNLFEQSANAICITTNGFVKSDGCAVMGRGCAAEAAKIWPDMPRTFGTQLRFTGNCVQIIRIDPVIVAFPVKPIKELFDGENAVRHMAGRFQIGQMVPGWACKARPCIIRESATSLAKMADNMGWTNVILPRPGCGAGELDWKQIEPMLQEILDDRFSAITF